MASRATRKRSGSAKRSSGSAKRSGSRKASSWAMEVKKVYAEMKKKMGSKATLGMAMKECSRRRKGGRM